MVVEMNLLVVENFPEEPPVVVMAAVAKMAVEH